MSAPTLHTERLTLRAHAPADLDDSAAMWADPAVVRHIGGVPFARADVWQRLLRYAGLWALLGYGYWIVRERASGRFVGEVGLADFKRDLTPGFGDAPECGWALAPGAQGQGYGREALGAVLAWADAAWPGGRTVCMIDPHNEPSIRLAREFGYAAYAQADYKGVPTQLYERLS